MAKYVFTELYAWLTKKASEFGVPVRTVWGWYRNGHGLQMWPQVTSDTATMRWANSQMYYNLPYLCGVKIKQQILNTQKL